MARYYSRNEVRDETASISSPDNLLIRRCPSSEFMSARRRAQHSSIPAALFSIVRAGLCCVLKKRSVSDHRKRWNVHMSQDRNNESPSRHWEFRWRRSARGAWEAIKFWTAPGLCHQSHGWCSHHSDGNSKVSGGGLRVCKQTLVLNSTSNRRFSSPRGNGRETGN